MKIKNGTIWKDTQGNILHAHGGWILLHEGVGGYVLEAVVSFTAAVVLTVLYIKFRKKKQTPWKWGENQ